MSNKEDRKAGKEDRIPIPAFLLYLLLYDGRAGSHERPKFRAFPYRIAGKTVSDVRPVSRSLAAVDAAAVLFFRGGDSDLAGSRLPFLG